MSDFGDYEDEMRRLNSLSDRDIDRLFGGKAVASPEFDELAAHLRDTKTVWLRASEDLVQIGHVAEIGRTARHLAAEGHRSPSKIDEIKTTPRRSPWRRAASLAVKTAAASLSASLSMIGLAYAGVDLPGTAAERAVEAVLGVELPNQEHSEAAGEGIGSGRSIGDFASDLSSERGCAFGQTVSELADARSEQSRQDEADGVGSCRQGSSRGDRGDRSRGAESSAKGRRTAAGASHGRRDTGDSTSGEAQDNNPTESGRDTGDSTSGEAQDNNPKKSGRDTGDSTSGEAQDNNPTESGRDTGDSTSGEAQDNNPTESDATPATRPRARPRTTTPRSRTRHRRLDLGRGPGQQPHGVRTRHRRLDLGRGPGQQPHGVRTRHRRDVPERKGGATGTRHPVRIFKVLGWTELGGNGEKVSVRCCDGCHAGGGVARVRP